MEIDSSVRPEQLIATEPPSLAPAFPSEVNQTMPPRRAWDEVDNYPNFLQLL
jgi:hypothetical protein